MSNPADVIRSFYEKCLNQFNSDLLPQLFTDDVALHSSAGDALGIDAVRRTVANVHAMFPQYHFTVEDIVVNGDKAAARWTMTAINSAPIAGVPPTGRPITNSAIVFYRFRDGRIAELWLQMDQVGVFRQIGVPLPGPSTPATAVTPALITHRSLGDIMRFTVLGATGGIGRLLIQQALDQGHHITAFARTPKKLTVQSPRLSVVGGDLYNAVQMADAMRGSDAVLSAFGPTTLRRTHLRRNFARTLVSALHQAEVNRFLHVSSAFCFREGGLLYAFMTNTLFRNVTNDHCDADQELAQSGLRWTVLRPPRLLDGPARNHLNVVDGHLACGLTITRADVASFMLQEASAPTHLFQFVGLSN